MSTNLVQLDPFKMKYLRLCRGVVVDNKDPKKMGRVRVRIRTIHGGEEKGLKDEQLPWAYPLMLDANYNSGSFVVPETNTSVGILFENGDKDQPVYIGGFYASGRYEQIDFEMKGGLKRQNVPQMVDYPRDIRNLDTRVLYRSPKGHRIVFRDDDSNECFVVADCIGQSFWMQPHLKPKSIMDLHKMDDKDSGIEGIQPDEYGNTPTDREKWGLCSQDPVMGFRANCGSSVKITSSNVENKFEIFSEHKTKATVLMKSSEMSSSFERVAGLKGLQWKVSQNEREYSVTGPMSKISMDIMGNITLKGISITLDAPVVNTVATTETHTGTAFTVLSGVILLIDKCPSTAMPIPNRVQQREQVYPQLNVKVDAASGLADSSIASLADTIGSAPSGGSGSSQADSLGDAANNAGGVASDVGSSIPSSRSMTDAKLYEYLKECCAIITTLSSYVQEAVAKVKENEPIYKKLEGTIKFAASVKGKEKSYLTSKTSKEDLIATLEQLSKRASDGLSEQIRQVISSIKEEIEKQDYLESLLNSQNLADFLEFYTGLLEDVKTTHENLASYVTEVQGVLKEESSTLYREFINRILSIRLTSDYSELIMKCNLNKTCMEIIQKATDTYKTSVGFLLKELWFWSGQSSTLRNCLEKIYDKVIGDTVRDYSVVKALQNQIDATEDEKIKVSLQAVVDSVDTTQKYWEVAERIYNGENAGEVVFEEERANHTISEDFKSAVLELMPIDIVSEVIAEVKKNYKSSEIVTDLLRKIGCQVTTV